MDYAWVDSLSSEDVEWIAALPFTISLVHERAVVVHAGLKPFVEEEGER